MISSSSKNSMTVFIEGPAILKFKNIPLSHHLEWSGHTYKIINAIIGVVMYWMWNDAAAMKAKMPQIGLT